MRYFTYFLAVAVTILYFYIHVYCIRSDVMAPTVRKGDLCFATSLGLLGESFQPGDVVTYAAADGKIHMRRLVDTTTSLTIYSVKADAQPNVLEAISRNSVQGKVFGCLPYAGLPAMYFQGTLPITEDQRKLAVGFFFSLFLTAFFKSV